MKNYSLLFILLVYLELYVLRITKKSENKLQTSHLEENHIQITCCRIWETKKLDGDYGGVIKHQQRRNVQLERFLLSVYFSQD